MSIPDLPMLLALLAALVFFGLLSVVAAVLVIALLRARPEDIPTLVREAKDVFVCLAARMPGARDLGRAASSWDTATDDGGTSGHAPLPEKLSMDDAAEEAL